MERARTGKVMAGRTVTGWGRCQEGGALVLLGLSRPRVNASTPYLGTGDHALDHAESSIIGTVYHNHHCKLRVSFVVLPSDILPLFTMISGYLDT